MKNPDIFICEVESRMNQIIDKLNKMDCIFEAAPLDSELSILESIDPKSLHRTYVNFLTIGIASLSPDNAALQALCIFDGLKLIDFLPTYITVMTKI